MRIATRILLAAATALAALATSAQAQSSDSCTGQPPTLIDFNPQGPALTCADPTMPQLRTNGAGITGWRWCRSGDAWRLQIAAVTWDHLKQTPSLGMQLLAAPRQPSDATVDAIARAYIRTPLGAPELVAVWCPWRDEIRASRPASTAVEWRTPLGGTGTLYAVVGGKRASIIPGRTAPAGALCDCRAPIVYLSASFCPLAAGPAAEVTLCRQATP